MFEMASPLWLDAMACHNVPSAAYEADKRVNLMSYGQGEQFALTVYSIQLLINITNLF